MGKGDKKTRRGKIILGTFGARRRRKVAYVKEIVPVVNTSVKELKEKKPVKEKAEAKDEKVIAEVKPAKEKAAPKAVKAVKEKKEEAETQAESKPKKEKKS